MSDENSRTGILSVEDAVSQLMGEHGANPDDEDQAAPDAEVDEAEETEADEAEDETDETGDDDEDEDDDEATAEDGDKDESDDPDEVKRGQMRQADYTRKTQELAREREQLSRERQQFEAHAQQQLQQLEAAVKAYSIPTDAEPDWPNLARTLDPKAYQQRQAEWADKQRKSHEARTIQERIVAQRHEEQRQREAEQLYNRIPEWRDESILKADTAEIVALARDYGVSAEEVGSIMDHRQLAMLRDLAKARRSQQAVSQKKAKPRKKVNAGAAPAPKNANQDKAMRDMNARLKKTGSPDDAAALLMARARA